MRLTGRVLLALTVAATLAITGACAGSKGGGDHGSQNADNLTGVMNGTLPTDGPAQEGGSITVTDLSDAPTLDVQATASSYTHAALSGLVYNKLVTYKTGRDLRYGSGQLVGDLAESWTRSDDGLDWTFNLRKGVKFQDIAPVSGREFTADDVVCTFNRSLSNPGAPGKSLLSIVDHLSTPDPYTAVFTLKEPHAAFDQSMAQIFMEIVPCEGTRGDFDMATTAIGTGPFTLAKWDRNVQRTYAKNPNYFVPDEPHISQLNIQVMSDTAAIVAAFRSGNIDMTGMTTEQQVPAITSTNPEAVIRAQMSLTMNQIMMNEKVKPFDDLRVRKAISMAWDRVGMANVDYSVYNLGMPYPATLDGGVTTEEANALIPYDPDAAKALLADAGFPNGFSVDLLTTSGYGPTVVNEAQWLQNDLKKIGIDVTLKIVDYATYFAGFSAMNYSIAFGYATGLGTADEWLQQYYLSTGSRNWFGINDPQLDSMITAQRGILDPAARTKALHDIGIYLLTNVVNPAIGGQANVPSVMQPWVHNLYEAPGSSRDWAAVAWVDANSPSRK
ncbi:MAG: ABC transporter substrate-binding protein [Frankiaceae bacterium]|jgi:peptide/nickel transport system substrate-binding protein|nr:ABC transporter substrate-binding protein [Frankiaceae bacterium]